MGTTTGVLQKVLKMVTSCLQAERRSLEDILANSLDCMLAVAFRCNFSPIASFNFQFNFLLIELFHNVTAEAGMFNTNRYH